MEIDNDLNKARRLFESGAFDKGYSILKKKEGIIFVSSIPVAINNKPYSEQLFKVLKAKKKTGTSTFEAIWTKAVEQQEDPIRRPSVATTDPPQNLFPAATDPPQNLFSEQTVASTSRKRPLPAPTRSAETPREIERPTEQRPDNEHPNLRRLMTLRRDDVVDIDDENDKGRDIDEVSSNGDNVTEEPGDGDIGEPGDDSVGENDLVNSSSDDGSVVISGEELT